MRKRRLKKSAIVGLGVVGLLLFLIVFNTIKHYTSYEYKLGKIGYSESEIIDILNMDDEYIKYALENKYDKYFTSLADQKYFIWKNYKKYVSYIKKDEKVDYSDVVALVNVKADNEEYTHTKETNMKLGYGILVNKYYSLPDKYAPDDIVKMNNSYAYENNSTRKDVYEAFKEMADSAKGEGITLIVNSSYRSYDDQKRIYSEYEDSKGSEYADKYAARPNFSEHQTGLALDIFTPGTNMKNFENSKAFEWLSKNSYKYGFILRYPKDKENLTGYAYESWHYRYLGKDLAKKVFDSNLTFDEYYAYYLDK